MTDTARRTRRPRGITTGGQFATEHRTEAHVNLHPSIDVSTLHPMQRERLDALVYEVAHDIARDAAAPEDRREEEAYQEMVAREAIESGEHIGYLRQHGYDEAHVRDLLSDRGRKVR